MRDAFRACFDENEAIPDIILMRARRDWQEYWIGDAPEWRVRDAFIWKIVWINPEPHIGPRKRYDTGVAVIEDYLPDEDWGETREDAPFWKHHRFYANWPTMDIPRGPEEPRYMVHAEEIWEVFERFYTPEYWHDPIERHWVRDAELPLSVINGVPESDQHAETRDRPQIYGVKFAVPTWEREYLNNPDWEAEIAILDQQYAANRSSRPHRQPPHQPSTFPL